MGIRPRNCGSMVRAGLILLLLVNTVWAVCPDRVNNLCVPYPIHAMTWFVPGEPVPGDQVAQGIVRSGLTNCTIKGAQIAMGTVAAVNATWNVKKCTANCNGSGAPTFTAIYTTDDTINNDRYNVKTNTTFSTTNSVCTSSSVCALVPGDLLQVNIGGTTTGTKDYTITLTYSCDQ
jgi:hypothetical protein